MFHLSLSNLNRDYENLILTSIKDINPRLKIKVFNGSDILCQNNNDSSVYCLKNNQADVILIQFFLSNYGFSNLLPNKNAITINLNTDKVPIIDSTNISLADIMKENNSFKVKIPNIQSFENTSFGIALQHNDFTPQQVEIEHFEYPTLSLNRISSFLDLGLNNSHRTRISTFVNTTQESASKDTPVYLLFGVIIIMLILSIVVVIVYKFLSPFTHSRHLYPSEIIQENEIYQKGMHNGKIDNSPNIT